MKLTSRLRRFLNPAVKESMDNLPAGICCYWPGGIVKLKNRTMEELSFAITGRALLDGEGFWRALVTGVGRVEFLDIGDTPAVRLGDGTVRGFSRTEAELDGRPLYIVLSKDLTEEYDLRRELLEKRKRVAAMVERQRALNREIGNMIREREILAMKTHIHDDLSRALLSGRQYLAHPDEESREALTRLWTRSVHILRHEGFDHWHDSYENAYDTARIFGITLTVEGALPQEGHVKELLSAAMVCCLSNAFRHAGADVVRLRIAEAESEYRVELTNNGAPPSGTVAETGGLANLRQQVESAGGTMRIQSSPRFILNLAIPKE